MRWGSSGELSLLGSTVSGGGKTKPDSWPGGAALRGEKRRSETEPTRVLAVESTAETGVGRDIVVGTRGGDEELWRARRGEGRGGGKSDIKPGGEEAAVRASFSESIWDLRRRGAGQRLAPEDEEDMQLACRLYSSHKLCHRHISSSIKIEKLYLCSTLFPFRPFHIAI